jgi:mutator protein MutT
MSASPVSRQRIAIAVVEHEGRYLIRQRPPGSPLAGLWEFPGGKVHPGEDVRSAAVRECREETGLGVAAVELLAEVEHTYAHGDLRLSFISCVLKFTDSVPQGGYRWVEAASLGDYDFPAANSQVLATIARRHSANASSQASNL